MNAYYNSLCNDYKLRMYLRFYLLNIAIKIINTYLVTYYIIEII